MEATMREKLMALREEALAELASVSSLMNSKICVSNIWAKKAR